MFSLDFSFLRVDHLLFLLLLLLILFSPPTSFHSPPSPHHPLLCYFSLFSSFFPWFTFVLFLLCFYLSIFNLTLILLIAYISSSPSFDFRLSYFHSKITNNLTLHILYSEEKCLLFDPFAFFQVIVCSGLFRSVASFRREKGEETERKETTKKGRE